MKRLYVTQTHDVSLGYHLPGDWNWTFVVRCQHIRWFYVFVTYCCSLFSPSLFLSSYSSKFCLTNFVFLFVHFLFNQSINQSFTHSFIHSFIMYILCLSFFLSFFILLFIFFFLFFYHFASLFTFQPNFWVCSTPPLCWYLYLLTSSW